MSAERVIILSVLVNVSLFIAEATGRTLGKGGKGQYETNVAFSVPLFSYTMPGYREYPSSSDLVAQAAIALGSLGLLATVAYIPFYVGLDGSTVVGRSGGPLETMAGLADSFSRAFGLEECGQVFIYPTTLMTSHLKFRAFYHYF